MVTGDNDSHQLEAPKVFANNGAVYGVAGDVLYLNELRYAELPAPPQDASETDCWITRELLPVIREIVAAVQPKRGEDGFSCNIIVAANGRAYEVADNVSWTRNQAGLYGIGTGFQYGFGALSAGADMYSAIRVAAKHDAYTGFKLTVTSASDLLKQ